MKNNINFFQAAGIHWANVFETPSPDETITMGHILVMLAIDGIVFIILTWYFEAVFPGGEGVPQKPYFFILVIFLPVNYNFRIFILSS